MSNTKITISVGMPSILMIFVVLTLTTFGVLSYITVKNDLTLTENSCRNVTEYYEANNKVEQMLLQLDNYLCNGNDPSTDKRFTASETPDNVPLYSFTIVVSNKKVMEVTAMETPFDDSTRFTVIKRQVVTTKWFEENIA